MVTDVVAVDSAVTPRIVFFGLSAEYIVVTHVVTDCPTVVTVVVILGSEDRYPDSVGCVELSVKTVDEDVSSTSGGPIVGKSEVDAVDCDVSLPSRGSVVVKSGDGDVDSIGSTDVVLEVAEVEISALVTGKFVESVENSDVSVVDVVDKTGVSVDSVVMLCDAFKFECN